MKRMAWGLLLVAYLGAFAANVGHFAWSYDVEWLQVSASAGYMIAWGWFLASGCRDRKRLKAICLAGVLTAAGGVLGLLARTFGSGILTILGLLSAGLTITPLYGLLSLIGDYDLFYLAAAVLGVVWLVFGVWLKGKVTEKET